MPAGAFRLVPITKSWDRRVGVIDIGSNSIRLVVYDSLSRVPFPVFNEKILCGLGRSIAQTGRLHSDGVVQAIDNLTRFKTLLGGMGIDHVDVLATAAVREAEDGPAFVADVKRQCDLDVTVISGEEEARLSAMGVLSGNPGADGVMGDLGGGSLELVGLNIGEIGSDQTTLPLGPLRLMDIKGDPGELRPIIDHQLDGLSWLDDFRGRTLYAVGGAWRSLARVHMEKRDYPLRIIHEYVAPAKELTQLAGLIAKQRSKGSLERLAGVSKRRLETLPYAAMVIEGLIERLRPASVVFSAYGLREGHLFDLLEPADRARDPLIDACAGIAHHSDRFGQEVRAAEWVAPLFAEESAEEARLRRAASLLSDIAWSEHPDYRAEQAMTRVLRLPISGLTHQQRAYLAVALYSRYGGSGDLDAAVTALLTTEALDRARLLGLALRLAHTLTGGASNLLEPTWLEVTSDEVRMILRGDLMTLAGDVVQRRLDAVAKAMDRSCRVVPRPGIDAAAG